MGHRSVFFDHIDYLIIFDKFYFDQLYIQAHGQEYEEESKTATY